jgi:hypothetical protein
MAFIIALFFIGVPMAQFMTVRSQNTGALPFTYLQLVQIYGYSTVPFVVCAFVDCIFLPYYRVKWALLLVSVGMSVYFAYKETII